MQGEDFRHAVFTIQSSGVGNFEEAKFVWLQIPF